MSSSGQGSKTRQEVLEEYEKDYLARLESAEKRPENLQNVVYQVTAEAKALEKKDYLGFCAFCMMGVPREEMTYKNNLLFHANCFEQQGSNFPAEDRDLLTQSSNAKVELVLLKNLKARRTGTSIQSNTKPRPKTKKKLKRKGKKRKPKRRISKKKKTAKKRKAKKRRPARRRAARRRTASRRKKTRKGSRRKTRKSTRRKTKRRFSQKRRKTRRRR